MSLETIDNNTLAVGDSNGMLYVLEIGGSMYFIHICKYAESLDISALDIRIGKVVKAEKHPKSRKLYIESIDIGGRKPLTVVSGLQDHVPLNELQVIQ